MTGLLPCAVTGLLRLRGESDDALDGLSSRPGPLLHGNAPTVGLYVGAHLGAKRASERLTSPTLAQLPGLLRIRVDSDDALDRLSSRRGPLLHGNAPTVGLCVGAHLSAKRTGEQLASRTLAAAAWFTPLASPSLASDPSTVGPAPAAMPAATTGLRFPLVHRTARRAAVRFLSSTAERTWPACRSGWPTG